MPNTQLNEAERETLNAAMAILERCTVQGAAFTLDLADGDCATAYFDSADGEHHLTGTTLADKVQNALDIEAYVQSEGVS